MEQRVGLVSLGQSSEVRGVGVCDTHFWTQPQHIAGRLYAAKAAVYRGRGLVTQLPWQLPVVGLFLVVDLFSGVGGVGVN